MSLLFAKANGTLKKPPLCSVFLSTLKLLAGRVFVSWVQHPFVLEATAGLRENRRGSATSRVWENSGGYTALLANCI